jgi:hypothetical protein
MIKKNIFILCAGLIIWLFISIAFYPVVVALIVDHDYPLFLNHLFFAFQSILSGFIVGLYGKSRGWIMGVLLGCFITLSMILIKVSFSFFRVEINNAYSIKDIGLSLMTYSLFTLIIVFGAILGEQVKLRKKRS